MQPFKKKKIIWCDSEKHNLLPHIKIIASQVFERIFQTINYKNVIEQKNDLEVKVDEQQHNKKYLLEQCDIEDEDKDQENTAARTTMKKNKSGNMCVTCHQRCRKKTMYGINISTKITWSYGTNKMEYFSEGKIS